jgi:hypothetical protein
MSSKSRQFRLTTWPATPVAVPPLLTFERYRLEARNELVVGEGTRVVQRRLNGHTFLELTRLDLEDAEAICAFANTHGLLRVGPGADWMFSWLPPFLHFDARRPEPDFHATELYQRVFARRQQSQASDPAWSRGESLEEFRFGANCIADLAQAWHFLTGESDRRSLRWRLPLIFPPFDTWETLLRSGPRRATMQPTGKITIGAAERMLSTGLTTALREFAPRVLRDDDPWTPIQPQPDHRGVTSWRKLHEPNSSLYLLCALELFNAINRGATWRECASEECTEPIFLDPDSGRRSNTIYHSLSCKNTQCQRNYRRNKQTATKRTDSPR